MAKYFQCELIHGDRVMVAWIEDRGARVGARVEIKADADRLWWVRKVYTPGIEHSALLKKQANDRNSLPSIIGVDIA